MNNKKGMNALVWIIIVIIIIVIGIVVYFLLPPTDPEEWDNTLQTDFQCKNSK